MHTAFLVVALIIACVIFWTCAYLVWRALPLTVRTFLAVIGELVSILG